MVGGERLVVGAEQSVGEFGFPDGGKEAREVVAGVEGGEPVLEPVLMEQVGAGFADEVLVYFDETGAVSDAVETTKQPGEFVLESNRVLLVCQDGVIELTEVQPSGKKMMAATDWARGVEDTVRMHTSATNPDEFPQH